MSGGRNWFIRAALLGCAVLGCESLPLGSDAEPDPSGAGGRFQRPQRFGMGAWAPGDNEAVVRPEVGTFGFVGLRVESSSAGGSGGDAGSGGSGGPELLAFSLFCGDGVRDFSDPITEECDDGLGNEADLCTENCQVADTAVVPLPAVVPAPPDLANRYLGEGRHPIAGSAHGFGVVFMEREPAEVGLSVFDPGGDPRARITVSANADPVLFGNPVVAALPNGDYAVAWTDFEGDGDELGIALRRVTPAQVPAGGVDPPVVGAELAATLSAVGFANAGVAFSQFDADMIVVGETLIVAWTDNTDVFTAPDIRYRTFAASGSPGSSFSAASSDSTLSQTEDVEGNVALAPFGSSFAAAWRSGKADGLETIEVLAQGVRWSVSTSASGHLPGAAEDRPALAEIDATHLLLLYTEGTDPFGTTVANIGRLRAAILDTADPDDVAVFEIDPQDAAYTNPAIAQSHPNLIRVGDRWYAAWRSASLDGDANGEDLWLSRLHPSVGPGEPTLLVDPEVRLPRFAPGSVGDQRFPAFAAVPTLLGTVGLPGPAPDGGLAVAWTDFGQTLGPSQGKPDVLAAFYPEAVTRFPQHVDCTVAVPCGPGEGDCDSDAECEPGLICPVNSGNGPNFGLGPHVDACVVNHCTNGIQDADETNIDCGGADCGQCLCGDGIPMPVVGEECDDAGDSPDCDSDCTLPECGDLHVNMQAGEECEDGNQSNTDSCTNFCLAARCGDGFPQPPEQCDDGNQSNTDSCTNTCQIARCGDGFVQPPEQCEDGNQSNTDACVSCRNAFCGDGFVQAGIEVCDKAIDPKCNATCTARQACTTGGSCLTIEHRAGGNPSDSFLNPQVRIKNNNPSLTVSLNQLRVRYWFTRRDVVWPNCVNPSPLSITCDFANVGCQNVAFSHNEITPALRKGDSYVEFNLSAVSGSQQLGPGQSTEVNFRLTRLAPTGNNIIYPPIGPFNQSDDYSYLAGSSHQFNPQIALYHNNEIVWGVEPSAPRVCGDFQVDACEFCDAGPSGNTNCRSNCTPTYCTTGAPCLRVQHRTGDPNAPDDNAIKPHLQIVNLGAVTVAMPELRARYWFTKDAGATTFASFCDHAVIGCALITRNFFTMTARPGADRYFEVGFTSTAPSLAPGANSSEMQLRFNKTDFSVFDENKDTGTDPNFDYSWRSVTTFSDWSQVGLYRNGTLIWGTPP